MSCFVLLFSFSMSSHTWGRVGGGGEISRSMSLSLNSKTYHWITQFTYSSRTSRLCTHRHKNICCVGMKNPYYDSQQNIVIRNAWLMLNLSRAERKKVFLLTRLEQIQIFFEVLIITDIKGHEFVNSYTAYFFWSFKCSIKQHSDFSSEFWIKTLVS